MIYVLPFIAFMSLCSALVGSAGLSALLGLGSYLIVVIIIGIVGIRYEGAAEVVGWILPNAIKHLLEQDQDDDPIIFYLHTM